ncbi:hypothetical protein HIO71_14085 [Chryseobacterium aquaticum]|uniref:Uncharacterized protein n=1 Tax=Chryseobacterium aquaticum TaxID=452084 RepID=A0A848N8K7_9FLAO|nr:MULTISPECIES: hypothetical protein [Chryseobacterium]NMR35312.1 hypothetical protein [Chryseobacterium aquaticum]NRQ47250.1 hypothetical protein [Chryseobacterium sp. C-204]
MENKLSWFDRVITPKTKAYKDFEKEIKNTAPEIFFRDGERRFSNQEKKFMQIYKSRESQMIQGSAFTVNSIFNSDSKALIKTNFKSFGEAARFVDKQRIDDRFLIAQDNTSFNEVTIGDEASKQKFLSDSWAKELEKRTDLSLGMINTQSDTNFSLNWQEKKIFELMHNTISEDIFYLLPADYDYNGLTDDLEEDDFRLMFSEAGIETLYWDFNNYRSGYSQRINEGGRLNILAIKIFHQTRDLLLTSTRKLSEGTFIKDEIFEEAERKIESLKKIESYLKFVQMYNDLQKGNRAESNIGNEGLVEAFNKMLDEYTKENNISLEKYLGLISNESSNIETLTDVYVLEKIESLELFQNESIQDIIGKITFYDSGEEMLYLSSETYLNALNNEFDSNMGGFKYETLMKTSELAKKVDDIVYDAYGDENPNSLDYYYALEKQIKNINNQNPHIMETHQDFDQVKYLKDQVKYLGFGEDEKLHKDLEKGINSKKQEFEIKTTSDKTLPENKVDFTLKFNKSESGGVFLNSYNAKLTNNKNEELSHNFPVSLDNSFTAKEAVNLLEGRSVKIEFLNPKSEQVEPAFVQFNFNEPKTEKGNYYFQNFYKNYGVDTAKIVEKSNLVFDKPEWKESAIKSLEKGNVLKVKYKENDQVIEGKAVLDPQNRNLKLYDNDMNRLNTNKPLEGLEQDNKHDKANVREQSIKR